MSASEHEFSESSSMDSPQSRDSPYSSPSQQVPHLANAFSGITCGDDVAFHIDDKKPCLRIVHHPQDHFRFRYKSEMVGTHGCLLGKTSDIIRTKSHPTVELMNYTGKALIRARLAQVDKDDEHPHQLMEDDEDREVSALVPQQGSYKVGFAGMGIIHKPKKHITALLMKNYMNRIEGSKNMSAKELRAHCENIAKEINLNIVRLRFSAHDTTTDKEICPPVFSEPIHNEKSAATNDLKICRISRYFGKPRGGDDVFILVEKVNKKNIVIRFYELDEHGEEVWSANGNFLQSDVHHQYAIVFRTPPYRDPQITKDVKVFIELVRPTDGRTSERKEFVYKADLAFRDNKRRRVNSSFSSLDSSSGGSVKNMNEVPTTVEMLDQGDRDAISNIPVFQINIPQIPVTAAAGPNDLADALLYSAGGVGSAGGPSPMLGAPNVPEPPIINIDSGEFERLIKLDPELPSDDRRNLGGMDWTEYMQSFGDSLTDKTLGSMDYLRRSMELVADSGNGKGLIKTEPVSPSEPSVEERKNAADQAHKNEQYTAFYTVEDGKEVKKLVREICEIMKNKTGYKKHVVRNKLERLFEMRLSNGDTFLHMALASNQPSLEYVVRLVHAMRMPRLLNLRNDRRQTALHLALTHDLHALLDTLLDKGCDPSAADAEGNNAIHYAVAHRGSCLKPLLQAIKKFHLQCDLNACNNEKQTPLHLASMYDSAASVELLVQHGCSVGARDALGRTPLHLAVTDDCHAAAKALIHLTSKNDIDALDGAGNTALQIVCEKKNICSEKVEIIKMLIDKEADPCARGGTAAAAGLRGAREPALRGLFPPPADDDVKSEPDDYESADEGDADGTLSGLSLWLGAVSERLDARGSWRELAARLHADALLSWYGNTASPASTLLTHIKESGDNVTSKSLMMHLQDMGEIDSANIIRQHIE